MDINRPKHGCGTCTLCCKLMAVKAPPVLDKPQCVWCEFAKRKGGCTIYEDRPQPCRDFECLWLASKTTPPELRPDKIHGLMTLTTDSKHLVLHEDPGYPGHAEQVLKPMLNHWIADGTRYYVVVCGKKRTFFGSRKLLPKAMQMMEETIEAVHDYDNDVNGGG